MATESVVQQLIRARYRKGWSQMKLAQEAGLSPTTILAIEKGRSVPRGQTLADLAEALDLDLDKLLDARDAEVAS